MLERLRARPAIGPVQKLHRMHHWQFPAGELRNAADVPARHAIGLHHIDGRQLALPEPGRDLRLQDVVSPGRAAANMPFRDFDHRKSGVAQELPGLLVDPLAMLHGARRMIGHADVAPAPRRLDLLLRGEFRDVLGQRRDEFRLGGIVAGMTGIVCEQVGVILHRGAAARGVDNDGVERPMLALQMPGVDVLPGHRLCLGLVAHVQRQRPAAAHAIRQHHVVAQIVEEAHGGVVDLRAQHLLRAAHEQSHAPPPRLGRLYGVRRGEFRVRAARLAAPAPALPQACGSGSAQRSF